MRVQSTKIDYGYLSGIVHDNDSNRDRSGSGFNPLTYILYPGQNLFRDAAVGLNFEHIMNGTAWDWQYVIREPEVDKEYGYRARIVYKPFAGRDDIRAEYMDWVRRLDVNSRSAKRSARQMPPDQT